MLLDETLNTIEFLAAFTILLVALGIAVYKLRKKPSDNTQGQLASVNPVSEVVIDDGVDTAKAGDKNE